MSAAADDYTFNIETTNVWVQVLVGHPAEEWVPAALAETTAELNRPPDDAERLRMAGELNFMHVLATNMEMVLPYAYYPDPAGPIGPLTDLRVWDPTDGSDAELADAAGAADPENTGSVDVRTLDTPLGRAVRVCRLIPLSSPAGTPEILPASTFFADGSGLVRVVCHVWHLAEVDATLALQAYGYNLAAMDAVLPALDELARGVRMHRPRRRLFHRSR